MNPPRDNVDHVEQWINPGLLHWAGRRVMNSDGTATTFLKILHVPYRFLWHAMAEHSAKMAWTILWHKNGTLQDNRWQ
jgi:hypothetical protein